MLILGAGCVTLPVNAAERFAVGADQPYKTISSALAAMKDGDVCVISAGTYRECINVRQNQVTLLGQGRVVITGCDDAGAMQPCEINGKKGLKKTITAPVYEVFRGSQYLMLARYPDKTSPMTSNQDWEESFIDPAGNIDLRASAQKKFAKLDDGYYVGMHGFFRPKHNGPLSSWYSISAPITRIGVNGLILVNQGQASSGFLGAFGEGKGLGYIIGAKAVLDAPGEWYCDGKQIILIPPATGQGDYELRTRLYGLIVTGNGVRLENIHFKASTARIDGNDVSLVKCAFEYISPFAHNLNDKHENKTGQSFACGWGDPANGTAGVFVKGDGFIAQDCRFSKSWWCGMMLRGNHARIDNCLFEDVDWIARRCAGLFCWGDNNIVRHCTFRNLGGAGIEGGNALWVEQYAKNNIWEYNYIENACQLIVDQGFFYVNHQSGSNPPANSIWRYNVGKGCRGPAKGIWKRTCVGYYIDNSSSGYQVHNNIAIDASEAIRYNDSEDGPRAGKDIWFYNNTFYNCGSIGFGLWTEGGGKPQPDAQVILINNLAVPEGTLDFAKWAKPLNWRNNLQSLPASALKNPDQMDFTPTDDKLKTGGVPVQNQKISYIGAVDPEKGMWRYGADESKLPEP